MHDIIKWNTGREYTRDGQWIAAQYLQQGDVDDAVVIFYDKSRGIWGKIDAEYDPTGPWAKLEDFVMRHYDAGHYSWHPQAGGLWGKNDL